MVSNNSGSQEYENNFPPEDDSDQIKKKEQVAEALPKS
jgi:hypothetical protein